MLHHRRLPGVLMLAASLLGLHSAAASAGTRHYVLNAGSSITSVCNGCGEAPAAPEPLTGTFEVTVLPVSSASDIAAVTSVTLSSVHHSLRGRGFLQRLGPDRQAMVLDSEINGQKVLFTSGRRQHRDGEGITIILSSPRTGTHTYVLVLSASPVDDQAVDTDGDSIADTQDNCPTIANGDQADGDADHVGDACDQCADTADEMVTRQGCSIAQLCPCEGPAAGRAWESQRDYLRCVAQATRTFRRSSQMSRAESLTALRRASRSGCGRMIVALR